MRKAVELPDPFALTANIAAYVAREATERALAELIRFAREEHRPAALLGPPGLGKTLLLHLLADRVSEELRPVYLPYAAVPPEELCSWALTVLGSPQIDDSIAVLEGFVAHLREQGSGLLLLIDDASAMPLDTARWLRRFAADSEGALRLVVAAMDTPAAGQMIAAIASETEIVRLTQPMTEAETREYVAARLALARVPESARARFDDATVSKLHQISAGVPRCLHGVASAVLRGATPETVGDRIADDEIPGRFRHRDDAARAPSRPVSREGEAERAAPAPAAEPTPAVRPGRRLEPPLSGRRVFVTALLVAAAAALVPLLRGLGTATAPGVEVPGEPEAAARSSAAETREPPPERAAGVAREPPPEAGEAPTPEAPTAPVARPEPPPNVARPAPPSPAAAGLLRVQVNAEPWAAIEVDGLDIGVTPLAGIPLVAGPHTFRARMPDGRVIERVVEIDAENRFVVFE